MISKIKYWIAELLSHPVIGTIISYYYKGNIPNYNCVINTNNSLVSNRVKARIFFRLYESAEIRFIKKYLSKELDIIEVGSNIGGVSAHIVRQMTEKQRVICVEGNSYLIPTLKSNIKNNTVHSSSVSVHNKVIDYNKIVSGFYIKKDTLSSSVSYQNNTEKLELPSVTLQSLVEEYNFQQYALVMDIEGAEIQILQNDKVALKNCYQIIAELHQTEYEQKKYSVQNLIDILKEECGFQLVAIHGSVVVMSKER